MTQRLRPSKQPVKVTFREGFQLWLQSWKWSNIKKMWHEENAKIGYKVAKVNSRLDKYVR